jgi:hypothetical protein
MLLPEEYSFNCRNRERSAALEGKGDKEEGKRKKTNSKQNWAARFGATQFVSTTRIELIRLNSRCCRRATSANNRELLCHSQNQFSVRVSRLT